VAGLLTRDAAAALGLCEGTPVSAGVGDVNASALASADAADGAYHLNVGTGLCIGTHSARRRVDLFSGIATICAAERERYLFLAAQRTGGAVARWAAHALGFGQGADALRRLDAAAGTIEPGAGTPSFAPWLDGERVPVDSSALHAEFKPRSAAPSRAELAYAALAGVALNARWALLTAERTIASTSGSVTMLGGGAASDVWCRIFADMLQRPVQIAADPALSGARGAAMTAAVAAAWFPSLGDARAMVKVGRLIEPDRNRGAWAEARYGELRQHARAQRRRPAVRSGEAELDPARVVSRH
jgi:xylulokinase